jgi:enoyl-CoA hydratase
MAMGLLRAKRYVLTGDPLSAQRAEEFGLITEAVEPGTALERAMVYARRFSAGPQHALRTTKHALNQLIVQPPRGAFELSAQLEAETMRDPEAAAAMADLVAGGPGAMPPDDPPARA